MNKSLKQSMKERLKVVAKERNLTFEEVWHNLVLERFLARLCHSKYKTNFILIGGGFPAAAFGEKKEIMGQIAPLGGIYQAGTLSGSPIAMYAGIETLNQIEKTWIFSRFER